MSWCRGTLQTSREVFLTYAKRQGRGAGTALASGRLSRDNTTADGSGNAVRGRARFQGRAAFRLPRGRGAGRNPVCFAGGARRPAQRPGPAAAPGSVVRINRDGTVPAGNPFHKDHKGWQPEIWSYGHRNPQGMALDLQGNLWVAEHGAKGGDEVNRVRNGGQLRLAGDFLRPPLLRRAKIGEGTALNPEWNSREWYWDPSMAPSGMMIYSGRMWPEWRGDIFVGSLKFDYISRLSGAPLKEAEQLRGSNRAHPRCAGGARWQHLVRLGGRRGGFQDFPLARAQAAAVTSYTLPPCCRARGRGWCRNGRGSIWRNATARQSRRPAPR